MRGDHLLGGSGEIVPVHGRMLTGGLFDESTLTGGSVPVDHQAGDDVRSGVVNAGRPIGMIANATAEGSTYADVVRVVEQPRASSAPISATSTGRWSDWRASCCRTSSPRRSCCPRWSPGFWLGPIRGFAELQLFRDVPSDQPFAPTRGPDRGAGHGGRRRDRVAAAALWAVRRPATARCPSRGRAPSARLTGPPTATLAWSTTCPGSEGPRLLAAAVPGGHFPGVNSAIVGASPVGGSGGRSNTG